MSITSGTTDTDVIIVGAGPIGLATACALAHHGVGLAEVAGPCVSDERDNEGRSHLLHDGSVFGRIRLSRGGSSSLEIDGLDHATVIAIAALIESRQEAGA